MKNHLLLFVGANAPISDELRGLEKSFEQVKVLAPALRKNQLSNPILGIDRSLNQLAIEISAHDRQWNGRLSVWLSAPENEMIEAHLWTVFGRSAWIEYVPLSKKKNKKDISQYIQERLPEVLDLLESVSTFVYTKRKTSPLPLPLRNFRSNHIGFLQNRWYANLDIESLEKRLRAMSTRHRQECLKVGTRGHHRGAHVHCDDRNLSFGPADNQKCHGIPHLIDGMQSDPACFIAGRFRFGASLFAGFHYDVRMKNGLLKCELEDCDGNRVDVSPKRLSYINIFPNDFLL